MLGANAVEVRLRGVLERGDPSAPWRSVAQLLEGGQRIRPRLVLAMIDAAGAPATDAAVDDAAALELVHLSTLVHDDIIDRGTSRRGAPTLNAAHGDAVALLVGNIIRDHALTICSPPARAVLNRASLAVNLGQLWETQARGRSCSYDELFHIQAHKTAHAFRACAELASLHRPQPVPEGARVGAELAALAFQAVDDWLDHLPTAAYTRKAGAGDAANGVPTFLAAAGFDGRACGTAAGIAVEVVQRQHVAGPLAHLPLPALTHEVLTFVSALRERADALAADSDVRPVLAECFARIARRCAEAHATMVAS